MDNRELLIGFARIADITIIITVLCDGANEYVLVYLHASMQCMRFDKLIRAGVESIIYRPLKCIIFEYIIHFSDTHSY
jgi:hypothetical protein